MKEWTHLNKIKMHDLIGIHIHEAVASIFSRVTRAISTHITSKDKVLATFENFRYHKRLLLLPQAVYGVIQVFFYMDIIISLGYNVNI